ncbi:MAG: hypothetical protein IJN28_01520 [Selenomonadales bacterium]|nr:hypothetical protein [Selenomonadales bacterium]
MRNAHRPKALPNRKLPRGIERQDELIELIEKRFHQEDLIRDALQKADAKNTTTESASAEEIAAEGVPSTKDATTQESAYADEITAKGVPSAKDATTQESAPLAAQAITEGAYAGEVTAEGVPSKQDATTSESAPSADGSAPVEAIASSPSAEAEETASATVEASLAEPAESVTIRWHGQNETITDPRIWLTVFDTVREAGDVITREVAHRRFHGESYWKTCDALYLSTGTYYHHVRAILHYAFACAVYHRLIDPRPKHFSLKAK